MQWEFLEINLPKKKKLRQNTKSLQIFSENVLNGINGYLKTRNCITA